MRFVVMLPLWLVALLLPVWATAIVLRWCVDVTIWGARRAIRRWR